MKLTEKCFRWSKKTLSNLDGNSRLLIDQYSCIPWIFRSQREFAIQVVHMQVSLYVSSERFYISLKPMKNAETF